MALDRKLGRVSVPAVNLQRFGGMLARRGRSEELRFARFDRERLSGIGQCGGAVDEQARRVEIRRHLRDLERHALEGADRSAESDALLRECDRLVEARRQYAGRLRRDADPSRRQRRHRAAEAFALRAEQRVGSDGDVVEREVARIARMDAEFLGYFSRPRCPAAPLRSRNALTPFEPGPPVRNIPITTPQYQPLVHHCLRPLSTYPLRRAYALARIAAASEPASGSVKANPAIASPSASRGSQRASARRFRA